jgi:hypothetical protein
MVPKRSENLRCFAISRGITLRSRHIGSYAASTDPVCRRDPRECWEDQKILVRDKEEQLELDQVQGDILVVFKNR